MFGQISALGTMVLVKNTGYDKDKSKINLVGMFQWTTCNAKAWNSTS